MYQNHAISLGKQGGFSRAVFSAFIALTLILSACSASDGDAGSGSQGATTDAGGVSDVAAGDVAPGDAAAGDSTASDGSKTGSDAGTTSADATTCTAKARNGAPKTLGGKRPAKVFLPKTWDGCKKWPLIILLHGYTASGTIQNFYFGVSARVDKKGFVFVLPEGTKSKSGKQFWDATKSCCNFEDGPVDDVAYLRGLIEEAKSSLSVDPERIYVIGHSNGGFMGYRMACDAADLVAGVASLAGAVSMDASLCKPSRAVNTLQIHGTKDTTIPFNGTNLFAASAVAETRWTALNGCTAKSEAQPAVDFDDKVAGKETVQRNRTGCNEGTQVGFWKMTDSAHIPGLNTAFKDALIDHVLAWRRTPKP